MYHWPETLLSVCDLGFVLKARLLASQSYLSIQCFSEYRIPLPLVENLGTFSDARYISYVTMTAAITSRGRRYLLGAVHILRNQDEGGCQKDY